mgnify:CR=1 FL=1
MKQLIIGAAIAAFTIPALAADTSTTFGIERKLESETNHIYYDLGVSEGALGATFGFNWADTVTDNGDFNFSSAEVDLSYGVNDLLTIYVNNDFDDDLKHTETVVGGKVKF